jgi:hypothetical protein
MLWLNYNISGIAIELTGLQFNDELSQGQSGGLSYGLDLAFCKKFALKP